MTSIEQLTKWHELAIIHGAAETNNGVFEILMQKNPDWRDAFDAESFEIGGGNRLCPKKSKNGGVVHIPKYLPLKLYDFEENVWKPKQEEREKKATQERAEYFDTLRAEEATFPNQPEKADRMD